MSQDGGRGMSRSRKADQPDPPCNPIYAIPESVPAECTYLTAGKRYEVLRGAHGEEYLIADNGEEISVKWDGTAHLNGANWTRVVEGEESQDKGERVLDHEVEAWERDNPFPKAPYGCEGWSKYLIPQANWCRAKAEFLASRIAKTEPSAATTTEPLECAPGYHRRPPDREGQEVVAWTGSGSLMALKDGREGFIWPRSAKAHPIPLYAHPAPSSGGKGDAALREALEGLLKLGMSGAEQLAAKRAARAALSEAQAGGGE